MFTFRCPNRDRCAVHGQNAVAAQDIVGLSRLRGQAPQDSRTVRRQQLLADKQQQVEEEAVAISERNEEIRRGNELRTQGYGGTQSADNHNSAIDAEFATEENSEPIEEWGPNSGPCRNFCSVTLQVFIRFQRPQVSPLKSSNLLSYWEKMVDALGLEPRTR